MKLTNGQLSEALKSLMAMPSREFTNAERCSYANDELKTSDTNTGCGPRGLPMPDFAVSGNFGATPSCSRSGLPSQKGRSIKRLQP